jgi:hypothetical protein
MEPIDNLIRDAMPRAPRGIADAVEARLRAERRTRRALAGFGVFVAAAAALVLWLLARPAPHAPMSAWRVTSARAATVDGGALVSGQPLAVGAVVHVGDGEARLERTTATDTASVTLAANTDARVGDGAVELLAGSARLEGPEARLTGDVAEVTTLATGGAATVELRRNPMTNAKKAALAALLTVGVVDGGARVAAKGHDPVLLAKNDRTMVAPKMPPLTTRAPVKLTNAKKPVPAPKPAATPAPPAADPKTTASVDGTLDKDTIRSVIRGTLDDVRGCYEAALAENEKLSGHIMVRFTIVTKDGKGHVSEGEIQPDETDLNAPTLQQCLLGVISSAEFPPSVDGEPVVVSYPFVLKAE